MAAAHGTRTRYMHGRRCEDCKNAQNAYQQAYRERRADGGVAPVASVVADDPGPVEAGVKAEIAGQAEVRPGVAAAALALGRVLDNQRAVSSQPARPR